nr:hypothetical protein [Tanacetum cinerariifolium]
MNAKMTDPECVTHKVKIAPHDYSKENLLATFTPQKQLTPEQIYWSNDLMKLKSEALKERAKVFRPIKAFTVYLPNKPATLVPKVLPTKSQVKIHIFTLIQMFSEFDKTCKKRITPTRLTDEEWGFEQTKACYLQEVIPFFKTIKDNFKGIQKALTKEVKEIKDVFEELEAEVAQCSIDRKHDAIDRKNLLIANDNLIAECLSKEVFSVATKSELNVARFAEMHVANTSVEARCLALEAELATLPQNDLLRAENDKVKQHYKELYDSIKITRVKNIEQVTKLTSENATLKTSVSKDKVQPPVLTRTKHAVDVEPIVPRLRNNRDAHLDYLRHLKESVETIRDIVEESKVVRPLDRSIVSAYRYPKHSQELLEYAIGTCPQGSQQRAKQLANTPLIRKKQVTIAKPSDRQDSNKQVHVVAVKPQKTNVPVPPSIGVTSYPKASGSQPKRNPKTNRISPAKGANKLAIEDLPKTNKSHLRTTNPVNSSSRLKRTNGVVERRNSTLVEAARTMLIFFKALMFLWAEDVATACYTQNRSLIHTRHHKTPYELVHNKKPDLTFFRVFGALCYPTNDSEDLGKLQPTANTGIFVGYDPSRKGYRIYNKRTRHIMETIHVQFDELTEPMAPVHLSTGPAPNFLTPGQISSGLVPNPIPATPYAPPANKELEILFQPMFDEYLEPPRAERPGSPAQAAQAPVNSAGTPLSTTIDQDAPSPHISPSSSALQSHSLPPGVASEPHFMEDHNVAPVDNNPFVNIFAPEPHSEASSSGDISSIKSPYGSQSLHHLNK